MSASTLRGKQKWVTGFSRRLILTTTIVMMIVAALSLIASVAQFNNALRPYLLEKAQAVATSVAQDIDYALSIGIPFEELRGLDEHIADMIAEHPEISALEVLNADKMGAWSLARTSLEAEVRRPPTEGIGFSAWATEASSSLSEVVVMIVGAEVEAEVVAIDMVTDQGVGIRVLATVDDDYIGNKMASVLFDTLVTLISVALVAFQVVVVFCSRQLSEPFTQAENALRRRAEGDLRQYQSSSDRGHISAFIDALNVQNAKIRERLDCAIKSTRDAAMAAKLKAFGEKTNVFVRESRFQASIMDARIPLFVFCFAEELQKSFLPLFVAENYVERDFFARDIMMGLPISGFMFVIAALTPFAGKMVDKFGNKTLFLTGIVPSIGGYLVCYMASSGNEILLGRSITAVGYAVITISCMSYIAAVVKAENRARGMAIFVGVLMTATMCGTAIGAILADWLGYNAVFMVAVIFACIAGLLGWNMLSTDLPAPETRTATVGTSRNPLATLMRNTQFVLLILFCAIPAKIILTGFLYLFVPVHLASLDASQSEIGRIMMMYSLIIVPISPLASGLADRIGQNHWMVIISTIASGIAVVALYQLTSVAMVLCVVAILGIVHAFLKAPLIVAAMEAAEKSSDITRTGALSLLRASERIGSVIGPVVVAAMLAMLEHDEVAAILGASVTVAGMIMAALSWRSRSEKAHV